MANKIILFISLFIILIFNTDGHKIPHVGSSLHKGPVPPQPSQYSASVIFNGISGMYYADTTIFRDRLDQYKQNYTTIVDFEKLRQYIILKGSCSWSEIPGRIKPMLVFPTYEFKGNLTHNNTLCYKWTGCHDYEIPPAPYDYYATVNGNIPMDLDLPTIGVNIHFSNFTFGPPPPTIFDIPINCTQIQFNPRSHPILSRRIINKNHGLQIFC